jgi:hypothetical protein
MTVRQGFMLNDVEVTGISEADWFAFAAENRFDFVELDMEYGFAVPRVDPHHVFRHWPRPRVGHGLAEQAAFLRQHGDRISHVHRNDTRRDDDDEHPPVALGQLNFEPLATAIRETDWTGPCTHEVFGFDLEHVGLGKDRFDRLPADWGGDVAGDRLIERNYKLFDAAGVLI